MNHHYLIIFANTSWAVLHTPNTITPEEVESYLSLHACDVIEITHPQSPRSMVIVFNLHLK